MSEILATLDPTSMNEKVVTSSTELGVYVFRINLSHAPLDKVQKWLYGQ
jgi:pyruvate kinase